MRQAPTPRPIQRATHTSVFASSQSGVRGCQHRGLRGLQPCGIEPQRQAPAVGHRVTRVHGEVDEHLLELISEKIRSIDSVISTETFMYLGLRKQTYSWGVR